MQLLRLLGPSRRAAQHDLGVHLYCSLALASRPALTSESRPSTTVNLRVHPERELEGHGRSAEGAPAQAS